MKISDALSYHLRNNSVLIRHNERNMKASKVLISRVWCFNLKSGKKLKGRTRCSGVMAAQVIRWYGPGKTFGLRPLTAVAQLKLVR